MTPRRHCDSTVLDLELLDRDFDRLGEGVEAEDDFETEKFLSPERDTEGKPRGSRLASSRRRPRSTPTDDEPHFRLPDSEPPGWADP